LIDINYQDITNKYTVLMLACVCGRPNVVTQVIKYDVDLNLTRANEWSALQMATMEGELKCVKSLVTAGAKLN
jgi:ankyrin repeat protein